MHTEELRQLYLQVNQLYQKIEILEEEDRQEKIKENEYLIGQCFISDETSYNPCYYQVIDLPKDSPRYVTCLYFYEPPICICKSGLPVGYIGIKDEMIDSLKTKSIPINQEVFAEKARETLEEILKEYEKYKG